MAVFEGSCTAFITPFTENGDKINYVTLEQLIEFQLLHHSDALIGLSSMGEGTALSESERIEYLEFVCAKVKKRVPLLFEIATVSTQSGADLIVQAVKAGADGVLVPPPIYCRMNQRGIFDHYKYLASKSAIPVIAYNIPLRTGYTMTPKLIAELCRNHIVEDLVDGSGNFTAISEILSLCRDSLTLYAGSDDTILPMLAFGAKGAISAAANLFPRQLHDLIMSYSRQDTAASLNLQLQLTPIFRALSVDISPAPIKAASALLGRNAGACRPPLASPDSASLEHLRKVLLDFGALDERHE